ncbi:MULTISPECIES: hypothetical protein [unclassified Streptomyces]|uniref:hypothetical protein n=1 Tax=unclassified Streptomyces TaxID=2593676 RepID=UPI0006FE3B52|nr:MULTISPECIES: hypothetical protein [unclassified Streptomyces]KQX59545.1 hypothetical protein ASD33_04565 [Streptomyces sp. Root1304]KRB00803.1 hypothetical protein ASE09_04570 [Streptomyces sp. Root66D1]
MAIIDELRTPLYFAAGTADLVAQQAKKVPGLIEQIAAEAPARIEAVRNADPKAVQEKVTAQAKEAQATVQSKFADVVGGFDTDLKKLGETAQDFALRGVGVAAEYAVKAREKYEEVAAHGEEAVKAWRGEAADEIVEIAVVVEPEESKAEPASAEKPVAAEEPAADEPEAKKAPAKKATARKAPAKKASVTAEKE